MCGCHYHTNRHARCTCTCDHRRDTWRSESKPTSQPEPDIIIDPLRRAAKLSGLILELVDCYNSLDDHISDKELADKLRELADEFDPQPIREPLSFKLEKRADIWVVVFSGGGVRPASMSEIQLWSALEAS